MKYLLTAALVLLTGCSATAAAPASIPTPMPETDHAALFAEYSARDDLARATLAGGCFWCMEGPFEAEAGVVEAFAGYAGGAEENPSYEQVAGKQTSHREAVQIFYDPAVVSYDKLLEIYWRQIDPTDAGGQFADRGFHYTTAIFTHDSAQAAAAKESKADLEASDKFDEPIVTEIVPYTNFYLAEDGHQDFYQHAASRYERYKKGSGRADFIEQNWKSKEYQKPSDAELRETLTDLQYRVTQQDGTEKPFDNTYWNNKDDGIYVDIVSGEPLFASTHKYESGTGWPSFTQPIAPDVVTKHEDRKLFVTRTEVRSSQADSHLGHVFTDGPTDAGGLRYCMNSAAMRFVPVADLTAEGYGEYADLFGETDE